MRVKLRKIVAVTDISAVADTSATPQVPNECFYTNDEKVKSTPAISERKNVMAVTASPITRKWLICYHNRAQ